MESDSQLLERIKAGEREPLAVLYHRHFPSVWRYVFAQLRGDDQGSRDCVSETFLAAIRALRDGPVSVDNAGAWLTGIARHKVGDTRRLALKQGTAVGEPVAPDEVGQALEAADTREAVGRVMDRMDDLERTVLEWKYIEGLPVREIAERLNRTDKAIEAALYRARNSFRALYAGRQESGAGRLQGDCHERP